MLVSCAWLSTFESGLVQGMSLRDVNQRTISLLNTAVEGSLSILQLCVKEGLAGPTELPKTIEALKVLAEEYAHYGLTIYPVFNELQRVLQSQQTAPQG